MDTIDRQHHLNWGHWNSVQGAILLRAEGNWRSAMKVKGVIQQNLRVTDFKHVIEPFDAGEISFHSGWVFHRAGANTSKHNAKSDDGYLHGQSNEIKGSGK